MSDEPSVGEIGRRLDAFEAHVKEALGNTEKYFRETASALQQQITNGDSALNHRVDVIDERLRAQEQRPTVTPAAMWVAVGVIAAVVAALAAVIALFAH